MKPNTMMNMSKQFGYERVRNTVLELICRENLKPGDRLPSERELSRRLGLNHQTIRRGLASLVDEKVIDRQVGAGTFLRSIPPMPTICENTNIKTFSPKRRNQQLVGAMVLLKPGNFVAEVLHHLQVEAEKRELKIDVRIFSDLKENALQQMEEILRNGAGSLIIPVMPDNPNVSDYVKLVHASPIPVVIGEPLPGLEANCYEKTNVFGMADVKAIEMVCQYLKALNYGHIAFFGPDNPSSGVIGRRVLAYLRFANRYGMGNYVGLTSNKAEDVDRIVKNWSVMKGDLAVISYDDDAAIRLMTSLHKNDLRIPEDVAVIGFNNISLGETTDPPLSTVQFDYGYVVGAMLDHAQAMIRGDSAQAKGDTKQILVIRESCGGKHRMGANLATIISQVQDC